MVTAKDVPDMGEAYWALFSTIPVNEYSNQDLNDLENTGEECQNCAEKS